MGIVLRIFLIDDDDTVKRLPLTLYERLLRGDPEERLPQYAGKRVRYVEVGVELYQRKPIKIHHFQPFYLPFDSEGRIDMTELEERRSLSSKISPFYYEDLYEDKSSEQVIDARHHFARRRHDHLYQWTPTKEIGAAIMKALIG